MFEALCRYFDVLNILKELFTVFLLIIHCFDIVFVYNALCFTLKSGD